MLNRITKKDSGMIGRETPVRKLGIIQIRTGYSDESASELVALELTDGDSVRK